MVVRIDRTRMAMGRGSRTYAYAGYVLTTDAPQVDKYATTTSVLGKPGPRGDYYTFAVATRPAAHWQRPLGWDRYEAALAHERQSKGELLKLAQSVYPELAGVTEWPELWIELPTIDAEHATRYAECAS